MSWHKTCACKYRLNTCVCNDKQYQNDDKCRCEYKELINKGKFGDGFVENPSIYECKQSSDIGEYLDYANVRVENVLLINWCQNVKMRF